MTYDPADDAMNYWTHSLEDLADIEDPRQAAMLSLVETIG